MSYGNNIACILIAYTLKIKTEQSKSLDLLFDMKRRCLNTRVADVE